MTRSTYLAGAAALLLACEPSAEPAVPSAPSVEATVAVEPAATSSASAPSASPPTADLVAPPAAPSASAEVDCRPPFKSRPIPSTEAECVAAGGEMTPVCMMGAIRCVLPFKDAGKPCVDSSECEGLCLADDRPAAHTKGAGRCQKTTYPCGCFTAVVQGTVCATLCVD